MSTSSSRVRPATPLCRKRHGRPDRGLRHPRRRHRQLSGAARCFGVRTARIGRAGDVAGVGRPFRQLFGRSEKRAPSLSGPGHIAHDLYGGRAERSANQRGAGRGLARQYDEQTDAGRPRGIACQFLHLYQPAKWLTHGQVSTRHADEGRHPRLCSARQASRGCRPSSA